jgi:hypothetical protein
MKMHRRSLLGAGSAIVLGSAGLLASIFSGTAHAWSAKSRREPIVNVWVVDTTFETGQFTGQTKQSIYTFHPDFSLEVIIPDNRATTRLGKWEYDEANKVYRTTAREITFQGDESGYIVVQETFTATNETLTGEGQGTLYVPGLTFAPNKFSLKGVPLQVLPL